jgi:CheY-like chemotaxis protein
VKTSKRIFCLDFLLIDDDPSLNQLIRAALGTRKLRRLYESAIRGHFGGLVQVKSATHYAANANDARKRWTELAGEYQKEKEESATSGADTELVGHCTIAIIDFDMPGENGLELAASLKNEPVEMMLFTGRQPQMQAFLAESGNSQEDFGVRLTMLKGAPAQELNDGVLTLLKARLEQIGG